MELAKEAGAGEEGRGDTVRVGCPQQEEECGQASLRQVYVYFNT